MPVFRLPRIGPLSLAIPPQVGATSTGDGFGHYRGKKPRVVRIAMGYSCYHDCWHTGLLYTLADFGLTLVDLIFKGDELPRDVPRALQISEPHYITASAGQAAVPQRGPLIQVCIQLAG